MTAQPVTAEDRLPARSSRAARSRAAVPAPRDWSVALNLSDEGFAACRFDAAPDSPARTRRFLRRTLDSWDLLHVLDETSAVAAELVANAIRHALEPRAGRTPGGEVAWIALVHRDSALICAVADPSPALPVASEPSLLSETGRGLCIVAALSETWGHSPPQPTGKTVWARIPARPL